MLVVSEHMWDAVGFPVYFNSMVEARKD
jgi:hypothetical protein